MPEAANYWLSRFLFQRGLALVYLIAYLVALNQFRPLLGEHGLLPVPNFANQVPFIDSPSVFYLFPKDTVFAAAAWGGIALSLLALTGLSGRFSLGISMAIWAALWAIYISFANVGQIFYGYGWETMLLEAGFCAIFLGEGATAPNMIPLWILRWMEFRVMFGAGLIKLRGDSCWRDLTCLDYHYETQPIPNPLSWYFHALPKWALHGGVAFNHFIEIVVPFGYFLPQPFASIAGALTILFQLLLMLSGNLSFLNLLTVVLAIPMFDGRLLAKWISHLSLPVQVPTVHEAGRWHKFAVLGYAAVVVLLSIRPAINLVSSRQLMNASFEPLHLVNTYGAFGSIGRTRYEIIVEGSGDPAMLDGSWRTYEFKGKPGDPMRNAAADCAIPVAPRLADVVRGYVAVYGGALVRELRGQVAARRPRGAFTAARESVPGGAAALRTCAAVSLSLQYGRGTRAIRRMVAAGIGRPVVPGGFTGLAGLSPDSGRSGLVSRIRSIAEE